jgi:TPR repeat protein
LIIIVFFTNLYCSYFDDGTKAFEENNIEKALYFYKKSAISGNDEAIFILGKLYYNGKYVAQDLEKSLYYFEKISPYGHKKAKYNSAIIYANNKYKKHNYQKAYNLFLELAQEGYPKAQNKVGIFLLHGLGIDKDYKMAVRWFEQAYFVHNYKAASCNLAVMFANGYGVFPNFGRAAKLAQEGYKQKKPTCVKVYKEFKLHKYPEDKGFKSGYYKNF